MKRVVAQGTFDILHPGHVHYLKEAKSMGDRLTVIVARAGNVTHKAPPVVPGEQRVEMVEALDPVDSAQLGHRKDIFIPIEELEPDIIALGHDQHHDSDAIERALAARGIDCTVRRCSARTEGENELLSSRTILRRAIEQRG